MIIFMVILKEVMINFIGRLSLNTQFMVDKIYTFALFLCPLDFSGFGMKDNFQEVQGRGRVLQKCRRLERKRSKV